MVFSVLLQDRVQHEAKRLRSALTVSDGLHRLSGRSTLTRENGALKLSVFNHSLSQLLYELLSSCLLFLQISIGILTLPQVKCHGDMIRGYAFSEQHNGKL